MIFATMIQAIRQNFAKRAEFRRLEAEIRSLSDRDLADMRGDRGEMLHHIQKKIYG